MKLGVKVDIKFNKFKKNLNKNDFFTLQKILDKVVELVGGGSVINGAYPV